MKKRRVQPKAPVRTDGFVLDTMVGGCTDSLVCRSKVPQAEWLNNRNLFSHRSGGLKSEIKVLIVLAPSESHEGRTCSRTLSLTYK